MTKDTDRKLCILYTSVSLLVILCVYQLFYRCLCCYNVVCTLQEPFAALSPIHTVDQTRQNCRVSSRRRRRCALGFTLLINGVANKRIGVSANRPLPAFKTQEITRILKHDTLIRLMLISGCEWRSVCEKRN